MTVSSAPADNTRTSRAACGSRCWASSTRSNLMRARSAASRSWSVAERFQRRAHQFGGAQGGHSGLRRGHPDRGTQQHDLLVGLGELACGQPLGSARTPPDALKLNRIHTAFGAACQQVTQFGGEPDSAQRGPQLRRPCHGGPVAVFEVPCEQFADDAVLLGAGDQPRRRITLALRGETQHCECVRVHRADQRFADDRAGARREQCRRDGGARLRTEPRRTRQQQNRFRIGRPRRCARQRPESAGALAGARSTDHSHHAAHSGFGERGRRQIGVRCGHGGMTPRGSDKSARSSSPAGWQRRHVIDRVTVTSIVARAPLRRRASARHRMSWPIHGV